MSDPTLLDCFALISVQTVRINAELRRPVLPTEQCQARVELKLTPRPVENAAPPLPSHALQAELSCVGLPPNGNEQERLFTIVLAMHLVYRQMHGDAVDFETFSRQHAALVRQIYPILQMRLAGLLAEFGLNHIRLPLDILQGEQPVVTVH